MSLHAIPNVGFAGLHNDTSHHIIRLCFPALANPAAPSAAGVSITQGQMALVYDECIRPVVEDILKEEESYWPLTYNHENWRSTRKKGGHVTSGVCVPAEYIDLFGEAVLKKVRSLDFGYKAFFLHEFRGMKHTSRHPADEGDPQTVQAYLERFLGDLKITPPDEGEDSDDWDWGLGGHWYIDVGIEINSREPEDGLDSPSHDSNNPAWSSTLQWRKDSHKRLIFTALHCTEEEAEEISRHRIIDEVAHFTEIAGFRRVVPRRISDRLGIYYINCYTTDKNVTYLKDRGQVSKNTSCEEFLNALIQRRDFTHPTDLRDIFGDYAKKEGIGSNARFEVRMSLSKALGTVWAFDTNVLQTSLLEFQNDRWW